MNWVINFLEFSLLFQPIGLPLYSCWFFNMWMSEYFMMSKSYKWLFDCLGEWIRLLSNVVSYMSCFKFFLTEISNKVLGLRTMKKPLYTAICRRWILFVVHKNWYIVLFLVTTYNYSLWNVILCIFLMLNQKLWYKYNKYNLSKRNSKRYDNIPVQR